MPQALEAVGYLMELDIVASPGSMAVACVSAALGQGPLATPFETWRDLVDRDRIVVSVGESMRGVWTTEAPGVLSDVWALPHARVRETACLTGAADQLAEAGYLTDIERTRSGLRGRPSVHRLRRALRVAGEIFRPGWLPDRIRIGIGFIPGSSWAAGRALGPDIALACVARDADSPFQLYTLFHEITHIVELSSAPSILQAQRLAGVTEVGLSELLRECCVEAVTITAWRREFPFLAGQEGAEWFELRAVELLETMSPTEVSFWSRLSDYILLRGGHE